MDITHQFIEFISNISSEYITTNITHARASKNTFHLKVNDLVS